MAIKATNKGTACELAPLRTSGHAELISCVSIVTG